MLHVGLALAGLADDATEAAANMQAISDAAKNIAQQWQPTPAQAFGAKLLQGKTLLYLGLATVGALTFLGYLKWGKRGGR